FDAFRAGGLEPDAPLFFDRAVDVAGRVELAKFRTVRIPKTNMPVVGFFVCEHQTPQFVYRPEWAKHPNGARGILGITVIAEQPMKWAGELEKYFGKGSTRRDGDGLVADTGTQPVRYLTRADYMVRYPGVTPVRAGDHPALLSLRVESLAACKALLKKNGVTVLEPDAGRLVVPPGEAAHLTLEFAER
ncbi:MAG: VOC family protein, partial [Reyranella sp.]|nr:VOC family protein [Reyranella sp.]